MPRSYLKEHKSMNVGRSVLVSMALITPGAAHAEWSANLGFASDYYYRGIFQSTSSTSGGIDYEQGGFYAGTWAADVKDGLEVDGYFGYTKELGAVTYAVGFTGYYYTGDFDDTYQEINLSASYGIAILDIAVGEYDNFGLGALDYTYYSLTVKKDGFYGRYAGFSQDASGNYFEAGYGTTVAEIDLGINAIFNDSTLSGDGRSDQALVLTVGKSFDLK